MERTERTELRNDVDGRSLLAPPAGIEPEVEETIVLSDTLVIERSDAPLSSVDPWSTLDTDVGFGTGFDGDCGGGCAGGWCGVGVVAGRPRAK